MKKRTTVWMMLWMILGLMMFEPSVKVNAAADVYWPIDTKWGITTGYYYSDGTAHYGVDLAATQGTPIYATFDGTAEYYQVYTTIGGVKYLTSYGNCVYLTGNDGRGYYAIFGHMNAFNGYNLTIPSSQTKAQGGNTGKIHIGTKTVQEGDVLGYVGTTGNSSGNHLHFGLKVNGNFVNPTGYLNQGMTAKEHKGTPTPDLDWTRDERYPTPITAYPAVTSGKITVYNSSQTAYDQSVRYIAYNDLCTINTVYTNGYCSVTYPTSSGSHTEYAKTSDFIVNGVTPYSFSPASSMTTYIRSDLSATFGSVFSTDQCTVVGKSGEKLELIYPISGGGYKLGWVLAQTVHASDFPIPLYGYNASPAERTTVYESLGSMGTYYGQIFVDDKCTLNAVNVSEGWIQVTYPVGSSGTKTGYVYLDQFIPSGSRLTTFYTTTVTKQTTTYRKSDMAVEYGYVSVNDQITVVGKSGNKLQVVYPLDAGGYKIAWIYDTDVKKNLTGISVTSNPTKITYIEGQNLETGGLVVTANYDNGSTSNVTGSCSFSGYSSTVGVKTVTVNYEGKQTAFTVTVQSKSPTGIKLVSKPAKTNYYIGDALGLEGMEVQAAYDNGTTSVVKDYDVQGDDDLTSSVGNKVVPVTYLYNGVKQSTSFNIDVLMPKIQISKESVVMKKGDVETVTVSTEPASQAITWASSNETVAVVSDGTITAVAEGTTDIKAQFVYNGLPYETKTTIIVEKEPVVLEGASIASYPEKTVYEIGETLDTTGLSLRLTYSDGSVETVTSGYVVRGFQPQQAGVQNVEVYYQGKIISFQVTVKEKKETDVSQKVTEDPFVSDKKDESSDVSRPCIVVDTQTARIGELVTLQIAMKHNPGIISFRIQVEYDGEALMLEKATGAEFADTTFGPINQNPITVLWSDAIHGNNKTDGVIAQLQFRVKEQANVRDYPVTVSYDAEDVFNAVWENVEFDIENGSVLVEPDSFIPSETDDDIITTESEITTEYHETKEKIVTEEKTTETRQTASEEEQPDSEENPVTSEGKEVEPKTTDEKKTEEQADTLKPEEVTEPADRVTTEGKTEKQADISKSEEATDRTTTEVKPEKQTDVSKPEQATDTSDRVTTEGETGEKRTTQETTITENKDAVPVQSDEEKKTLPADQVTEEMSQDVPGTMEQGTSTEENREGDSTSGTQEKSAEEKETQKPVEQKTQQNATESAKTVPTTQGSTEKAVQRSTQTPVSSSNVKTTQGDKKTDAKRTAETAKQIAETTEQDEGLDVGDTVEVGIYRYTVTDDGEVAITGMTNNKAKKVIIPDTITIQNQTFAVTEISDGAFANSSIVKVAIGNNVKTIGASSFKNCKKLSSVTLGKNVDTIGKNAFKNCKALKKIVLPENLEEIGNSAFSGCKKLANITIKSSKLLIVEKNAFKGIKKTAKIKVPRKKLSKYKKLLKNKGQSRTVKIR